MLSLFMFLSGLFTNLNKIVDMESVRKYYLKKVNRFYPLYVIAAITLYYTTIPSSMSFYNGFSQLTLSLLGIATLSNNAPSTLWFMDVLLFFIIITPLFGFAKNKVYRILLMAVVYVLIYILSRKVNIVDARYIRYMPFYLLGLLLTPEKFLGIVNKYGIFAVILAAFLKCLLPVHHIFLDIIFYALCLIWGGQVGINIL